MTKQTEADFDAQIDAWFAKYGNEPEEPHAVSVDYAEDLHLLIVHLSNGLRLALPVENLQGLEKATPEQLRRAELHGLGFGFGFPELDADFYVPALIEGVYGNRRWMAQLGRKGGAAQNRGQTESLARQRRQRRPAQKSEAAHGRVAFVQSIQQGICFAPLNQIHREGARV